MPHDLFDDVVARRTSTGSRRSSVVVFSVVMHGAALVTLLVAPLMATGALPIPRRPITPLDARDIMPVVLPTPPQTPRAGRTQETTSSLPTVSVPGQLAPVVAPNGISTEEPPGPGGIGTSPDGPPELAVIQRLVPSSIGGSGLPPVPPPTPIHWHSGLRAPQKLVDVAPVYPAVARTAHIQGIVIIEATIDARGNVEAARILKAAPLLGASALEAVRQWKFSPTLLNGAPVPIIMTVTVNFKLE